ncbi:bone morphogenetic receptor type-1B-like [Chlorella sorokiniana]|uniref:Bone morphogenetic receptor type-1B-like n=1 Tax=Chlorella sorokiniana TaxID=3076 RepID=A0A2P6TEU5_CHLSO|nr:bone morphogenetic receptor type-1B-like [Chlorella sorokiniana]|eukprot:PRW32483.1 bone morphogenetic receptor type-1B-like [Chlorella sorokiniana]
MGAGLAARRLARALLQDAWPNAPGSVLCAIQSNSYGCGFDKHAALAAIDADTPKRRGSKDSNGVSTHILVIVLVICTVLTVLCVACTLWVLHRRHRRIEAQRRRAERRRQREKEEAAGNELRQVVIPVIVLGPCGEQLQVAFDDGYLEQRVTCPASRSVLSVADVAALYRQGGC